MLSAHWLIRRGAGSSRCWLSASTRQAKSPRSSASRRKPSRSTLMRLRRLGSFECDLRGQSGYTLLMRVVSPRSTTGWPTCAAFGAAAWTTLKPNISRTESGSGEEAQSNGRQERSRIAAKYIEHIAVAAPIDTKRFYLLERFRSELLRLETGARERHCSACRPSVRRYFVLSGLPESQAARRMPLSLDEFSRSPARQPG